jgi:hypothetical protein
MTEDQIDQIERRATLANDLKVLQQQGSTFHQHAQAQADEINQGRFAATGSPRVVGSTPSVASQYPAASAPFQADPVGVEPPLGFRIDEMPSLESSALNPVGVEEPGAPAGAASSPSDIAPPSRDGVDQASDAGAPSSQSAERAND